MKRQTKRIKVAKVKSQARPARNHPIRITEDEADAIISHRRLRQKKYTLEEVMRQARHAVES